MESTGNSNRNWGIDGSFAKIRGIVSSPNTWDDNKTTNGEHMFFILDGCRPNENSEIVGFLSEMLNEDLLPYRRVLDRYAETQTPLDQPVNDLACGYGFSVNRDWNSTIKVVLNDGSERYYKIDRFD